MERTNSCRFWVLACLVALHFTQVARAITDPEDKITRRLRSLEESHSPLRPTLDYRFGSTNQEKDDGVEFLIAKIFGNGKKETITQEPPPISKDVPSFGGATVDSQKPVQILDYQSNIPEEKIDAAIYDEKTGVARCPNRTATGFYVYPPDCGFYVNCDRGRPFLMACPPNTLFDSYKKICDYAKMVTCAGSETPSHQKTKRVASNPPEDDTTHVLELNIEWSDGKPKCREGFSGHLPYPKICTKMIHCDNGRTFIKDCGPGTVFNPAISVCDWPSNVKGCSGDAGLSKGGESLHEDNVLTSESYTKITKNAETNSQSSEIIAKDSYSLNKDGYKEDAKSTGIQSAQGSAGIVRNGNGEQGLSYDGESTHRSHHSAWSSGSHGPRVTGSEGKDGESSQGQGNYVASQDSSYSNIGTIHESSGNGGYPISDGSHKFGWSSGSHGPRVTGSEGKDGESSQGQGNYVASQDSSSSNIGIIHESSGNGGYPISDGSHKFGWSSGSHGPRVTGSEGKDGESSQGQGNYVASQDSSSSNIGTIHESSGNGGYPISDGSHKFGWSSGSHGPRVTGSEGKDGESSQGQGNYVASQDSSYSNIGTIHESSGNGGYPISDGSHKFGWSSGSHGPRVTGSEGKDGESSQGQGNYVASQDSSSSNIGIIHESSENGGYPISDGSHKFGWSSGSHGPRVTGSEGKDGESSQGQGNYVASQDSSSSNIGTIHESSGNGGYPISDGSHKFGWSSGSHGPRVTGSEGKDGESSQGQGNYVASQDSSSSNIGTIHESSGNGGYPISDGSHKFGWSSGSHGPRVTGSEGKDGESSQGQGNYVASQDSSSSNIGIIHESSGNGGYPISDGSHKFGWSSGSHGPRVTGSEGKDGESSQGQGNYVASQDSSSSNIGTIHESSGNGGYPISDGSHKFGWSSGSHGPRVTGSEGKDGESSQGQGNYVASQDSSSSNIGTIHESSGNGGYPISDGSHKFGWSSGSHGPRVTGSEGKDGESSQGQGNYVASQDSSSSNIGTIHESSGNGGYPISDGSYGTQVTGSEGKDGESSQGQGNYVASQDSSSSNIGTIHESSGNGGYPISDGSHKFGWSSGSHGPRVTGSEGKDGESSQGQGNYDASQDSSSSNIGTIHESSGNGGYPISDGSHKFGWSSGSHGPRVTGSEGKDGESSQGQGNYVASQDSSSSNIGTIHGSSGNGGYPISDGSHKFGWSSGSHGPRVTGSEGKDGESSQGQGNYVASQDSSSSNIGTIHESSGNGGYPISDGSHKFGWSSGSHGPRVTGSEGKDGESSQGQGNYVASQDSSSSNIGTIHESSGNGGYPISDGSYGTQVTGSEGKDGESSQGQGNYVASQDSSSSNIGTIHESSGNGGYPISDGSHKFGWSSGSHGPRVTGSEVKDGESAQGQGNYVASQDSSSSNIGTIHESSGNGGYPISDGSHKFGWSSGSHGPRVTGSEGKDGESSQGQGNYDASQDSSSSNIGTIHESSGNGGYPISDGSHKFGWSSGSHGPRVTGSEGKDGESSQGQGNYVASQDSSSSNIGTIHGSSGNGGYPISDGSHKFGWSSGSHGPRVTGSEGKDGESSQGQGNYVASQDSSSSNIGTIHESSGNGGYPISDGSYGTQVTGSEGKDGESSQGQGNYVAGQDSSSLNSAGNYEISGSGGYQMSGGSYGTQVTGSKGKDGESSQGQGNYVASQDSSSSNIGTAHESSGNGGYPISDGSYGTQVTGSEGKDGESSQGQGNYVASQDSSSLNSAGNYEISGSGGYQMSGGSYGTQVTGSKGKDGESSQGQGNYVASQDSSSSNIGTAHESSGNGGYPISDGSYGTQVTGSEGKDGESSQGQGNYVASQDSSSLNSAGNYESLGSGGFAITDASSIAIGAIDGFNFEGKDGAFSINHGHANQGEDLSSSINIGNHGISGSGGYEISHDSSVADGKGHGELDKNKHIEHGSDQWQSPSGSHDTQITGFGGTGGDSSQGEGHFTQAAGSTSLNNTGDHQTRESGGYPTSQGSLTPHDKENRFESNNPGGNQYGNGQWNQRGSTWDSRPRGNGGNDGQSTVGQGYDDQGSSSSNNPGNYQTSGSGGYQQSQVPWMPNGKDNSGIGFGSNNPGGNQHGNGQWNQRGSTWDSRPTGNGGNDGQSTVGQGYDDQGSSSLNNPGNYQTSGSGRYQQSQVPWMPNGKDNSGIGFGSNNPGGNQHGNGQWNQRGSTWDSRPTGNGGNDGQSTVGQGYDDQGSSSLNNPGNYQTSGSGGYQQSQGPWRPNGKDNSGIGFGSNNPGGNQHGNGQWNQRGSTWDSRPTGNGGNDGQSTVGQGYDDQGSSSLNNPGNYQTSGSGGYQQSQGPWRPNGKDNSGIGSESNNLAGNQYANGQWETTSDSPSTGNSKIDGQSAVGQGDDDECSNPSNNAENHQIAESSEFQVSQPGRTNNAGGNDGLGHELNNQAENQHGGLQQNWAFAWKSHSAGNKDIGVEKIDNGGVRLWPSSSIGSGGTERGLTFTIVWQGEHKWVTWHYTCPRRTAGKPYMFAERFILPNNGCVEIIPTDCDVIIIHKGPSGDQIWERRASQFRLVVNNGEYDDGSICEESQESYENSSSEEDVSFNIGDMLETMADANTSPTSDGGRTHGQPDRHNPHFHGHKHHHHHRHENREDGSWRQVGTRPDAKYPTGDRRHYGRTNTNLSNSENNSRSPSNENVQGRWIPRSDHNATGPRDQSTRDFRPSSWRGQGSHQNGYQGPRLLPDAPPKEKWNQGVPDSPRDKKLDDWLSRTNIIQSADKRREQDSKMNDWSSKTNIFNAQQGNKRTGVKTLSRNPYNNGPTGINVNVNGTKGHYITREIEVNQGHSNTRNYGRVTTPRVPTSFNVSRNGSYDRPTSGRWIPMRPNYGNGYEPIRSNLTFNGWKPMRYRPINETFVSRPSTVLTPPKYENNPNKPIYKGILRPVTTTESPSEIFESLTESPTDRGPRTSSGIELPTVTIEEDYHDDSRDKISGKANETMNFADVVEPDVDKYEVEVFEKEKWKPRSTFENKTTNDKVESVIMGINRKNKEAELIDVRFAPWHGEEPSFPVYYIAAVQPLGHTPKNKKITPATGQILRLRGGTSPRDGYLEVQGAHPGWGIVCDSKNGWSLNEAHIVCRQLGYARGAEMAWQGRNEWDDNEVPWIASTQVDCKGNETHFQTCKFVHGEQCLIKRDAVGIRCMSNRLAHCRDDEIAHEGQCYHLANPESAVYHNEAGDYCSARKAKLIDITTQAENNFLSEWLLQSYPTVNSIMTSGIGFNTLNRTLWLWEDSARAKFQFSKWWPGWMNDKKTPPRPGSRPVCVVMKKQFPCHDKPEANCTTDYFFWDVEDCAASMRGHSYICERSYDDISCVYGKGQLYAGNANVSASGKKCLPWNDKTVAHSLRINVLNSEVRNQLMSHNYCRNPNPTKSSRPWCYTGAYGEHDYCDIPPCGEIGMKRSLAGGNCKPKHFECMPGECIPSPWVCDGEEDCTNGIDERACSSHLGFFKKIKNRRLEGHDVEKWLNTSVKSCALRCKEADFTCRSFSYASGLGVCLLSDTNIGGSGALKHDARFDYYEMKDRSVNCDGMFVCENQKCVNQTKVCDGKNDCGDRSDEKMCTVENLGYEIRLGGSNATNEGRVEVKVLGVWGQVCDDGFGMNDANVVCKELGFEFGALQVRPGGYYGNINPPERFMVDQLKCRGNETSLRECDFDGWGVHNCVPEEAVGVICKLAVNTCQSGQWKCDGSPTCIPTAFICDEVEDCPDKSDESPSHCEAPFELRLANGSSPLEGRVEVRHHGVWGTVCDDDFSHAAAKVICKSLGYGGLAVAKKDGFFGPGDGPIWLDEVFCHGNETQLYKCEHNTWGTNNCDHGEDAGVKCTEGPIDDSESELDIQPIPEININDLLPSDCGKRLEDFGNSEDEIFQRVVRGSIAPKGSYPWQASLRIRGHSRSSHWCGAVVLSPLHVLTAAHCLEGYNKGTYFVRAGDYHTEVDEGTEVEANIEDYYIHEDFRKGQRMNNDIALVLLKGSGIPLGEHVMPICLPPANVEYSPNLNCTISGFGSIETGTSDASLHLRYGWVPLIDQSVCRASYVYGDGNISDGMICAGYLEKGVDACEGDSGGPLACQSNGAFTLYGITSWGHRCGETNKPGVYVRVAYYRDWIDRKIRESIYGR